MKQEPIRSHAGKPRDRRESPPFRAEWKSNVRRAQAHFFDGIYYPYLEAAKRRPYGLYVHGASDTGGAVRAVESITAGLQWRAVRPPVCVTGTLARPDLEACWELGALLAAELAG